MSTPPTIRKSRQKCPLCGKPASATHTPFCSPGCRDRDLLKWLGEGYSLPGRPVDEEGREIGADGLDSEG